MREQGVILEYQTNVAEEWRHIHDVNTSDRDMPGFEFFKARDQAQRRRLSAAGRPRPSVILTLTPARPGGR
jgi:hypothetical protein